MKMRICWLTLALIIVASPDLRSQGMVIETKGGTLVTEMLNAIDALTFPDQNLVVRISDQSMDPYKLQTIKKIYFNPTAGIKDNTLYPDDLQIYPNPAHDNITLNVTGREGVMVEIFSIEGIQFMEFEITSSSTELDISGLSPGVYLLRINGRMKKFVKQ